MAANNNEIPTMDPLQYPFDTTNSEPAPLYEDEYNRAPNLLLASLARYGQMVQSNQASLPHDRLLLNVEILTRFAEDSSLPKDFNDLFVIFGSAQHHGRHVFEPNMWNESQDTPLTPIQALGDLSKFEQLLFPYCSMDGNFVLFLVLPQQSAIEICTIHTMSQSNDEHHIASKIGNILSMAGLTTQQWRIRHRLHVPETFPVNPVVMTFLLAHELHQHRKYLDLTHEMIMNRKLFLLSALVHHHDQWLGKLKIKLGERKSHPFLTTEYKGKDKFKKLDGKGWFVIDVAGDGNCGFYCLILGLENLGNSRYSPTARGSCLHTPMGWNKPWQSYVLKLRKDLQDHAIHLINTVYTEGNRPMEWLNKTTAVTDDEFEELPLGFYSNELSQREYFDLTLTRKEKTGSNIDPTDYQMNPFFASLVAASHFKVRNIVYTRNASYNSKKKKVGHQWSTTTMNPTRQLKYHIVQKKGVCKLSDSQFKQMPTIEILYTTGYIKEGTPDSQHFQFLRRIHCDNVASSTNPTTGTLQNFIERSSQQLPAKVVPATGRQQPHANPVQPSKGKVVSKGKVLSVLQKGKVPRAKLVRERKFLMEQLTLSFDKQLDNNTSKHKVATRMKYDPKKNQYFIRIKGSDERLQKQILCRNTNEYDDELVKAAKSNPGEWIGPSVGDCGESNAPSHLCIRGVETLFQQHGNRYCLAYSLANGLFYCGFRKEAAELYRQAGSFANLDIDKAISLLREFMTNLVPAIGRPTLFGIKTHSSSRMKRHLTWDKLFTTFTEYPTIVVPRTEDGNATHAFCVVDDLIFDSITPLPLKLQKASVDWIFNGMESDIECALRFKTKVSPKGVKVEQQYSRDVVLHW